ncbi:hypothetical protein D3C72_1595610 [compost metagenome]
MPAAQFLRLQAEDTFVGLVVEHIALIGVDKGQQRRQRVGHRAQAPFAAVQRLAALAHVAHQLDEGARQVADLVALLPCRQPLERGQIVGAGLYHLVQARQRRQLAPHRQPDQHGHRRHGQPGHAQEALLHLVQRRVGFARGQQRHQFPAGGRHQVARDHRPRRGQEFQRRGAIVLAAGVVHRPCGLARLCRVGVADIDRLAPGRHQAVVAGGAQTVVQDLDQEVGAGHVQPAADQADEGLLR